MKFMRRAAALCATAIVLAGCAATDPGQDGRAGPGSDAGYTRGEARPAGQPPAGATGEPGGQRPESNRDVLCAAVPFDQDCRKY
jgi:hypothetical protein